MAKISRRGKSHQDVILGGQNVGFPYHGVDKTNSKFWGEGKWDNYIKPLLPTPVDELTFIEYGSSAGMYLKNAKKMGFRRVIGFERSSEECAFSIKLRDSLGLDYEIRNTSIDPNFDFVSLPLADVTLMANFHYHQGVQEFAKILDSLEAKTCYVLVVSIDEHVRHWRAQARESDLRFYFKNWTFVRKIDPLDPSDDPCPRNQFSMLFKSNKVKRVSLDSITSKGLACPALELVENNRKYGLLREFLACSMADGRIEDTKYYKKTTSIYGTKKHHRIMETKRALAENVKKNGLTDPICVDKTGSLTDGFHRVVISSILGYKSIISRI